MASAKKTTIRALDFENEYPIALPSHTRSGVLGITSEAVFSLTDDPNVILPEMRLDGLNQKKRIKPKYSLLRHSKFRRLTGQSMGFTLNRKLPSSWLDREKDQAKSCSSFIIGRFSLGQQIGAENIPQYR